MSFPATSHPGVAVLKKVFVPSGRSRGPNGFQLPGPRRPRRPRTAFRRRTSAAPRRGAAAVELAVVAPLLFLLIFGMIEFSRLMMVQQILTNASREGARRGILEQSTVDEVESTVTQYLETASISAAEVSVAPSSLSSAGFGDPVTVGVSISFNQVSWVPAPWFLSDVNIEATTVMRAERPE